MSAVDQSRAMLEELARTFPDALIECRQGEAAHLPIDDESVDYVFANMYLYHVEDPPRAIQEMARILKPGGRLVITDLDSHEFEFLRTEQHDRWMGFERAEVERWLRAAGLRNVRVECIDETCCASSTCGCSSASVSIFAAYGEK
nr:class I SAM-dependent methyltransferase [Spirochaeta thermophila]